MDKVKEELLSLFDGMLPKVGSFKRKTYQGVFEQAYEKYKGVISDISALCEGKTEEERMQVIEELSDVLPSHAYDRLKTVPKMKRERTSIDYNMNMVVYIVLLLLASLPMRRLQGALSQGCAILRRQSADIREKEMTAMSL